ncbi:hypothetical protein TNCV_495831 [Trichonephila clavipes]|nr:hypothetical protein TNCV_495831 [Trichonephila clavipes]
MVQNDRRITLSENLLELGLSYGSVQHIDSDVLRYSKIVLFKHLPRIGSMDRDLISTKTDFRVHGIKQIESLYSKEDVLNTLSEIEERRKPLYLMLRKGVYKTGIISDKALFHLPFTTGETKIQPISCEKRCKDTALLDKTSKQPGFMLWMEMSSQGLIKPLFVSNQRLKLMLPSISKQF